MNKIDSNKIDLNTCKQGDRLHAKCGDVYIYKAKNSTGADYAHSATITEPYGHTWTGTFTDDGVYCRLVDSGMRNIVKIEHVESVDLPTQAGFKVPALRPRREDSRGPEYGFYEAHFINEGTRHNYIVTKFNRDGKKQWDVLVHVENFLAFMADQH
jgi:hypothetical protein